MSEPYILKLKLDQLNFLKTLLPDGYRLIRYSGRYKQYRHGHRYGHGHEREQNQQKNLNKSLKTPKRKNPIHSTHSIIQQTNKPQKKTQPQKQKSIQKPQILSSQTKLYLEIVRKLREHKNSWMFHKPVQFVSVVKMEDGYSQIKEKETQKQRQKQKQKQKQRQKQKDRNKRQGTTINLDLYTIQKNIRNSYYENNFPKFSNDLQNMIKNGYIRHVTDKATIIKIKCFQKYCCKLLKDIKIALQQYNKTNTPTPQKSPFQPSTQDDTQTKVTLLQKKQLQDKIKLLKYQHLQVIKQILFGAQHTLLKNFQLDFKNIPAQKFRQIQKYVKLKLTTLKPKQLQNTKSILPSQCHQQLNQQSSFATMSEDSC